MVKRFLTPFLVIFLVTTTGCENPPPQAPHLTVNIVACENFYDQVFVDAQFFGPPLGTASAGLYSGGEFMETQVIDFDASGFAFANFESPFIAYGAYAEGTEFTVGITDDGGEHLSTDTAAAYIPD